MPRGMIQALLGTTPNSQGWAPADLSDCIFRNKEDTDTMMMIAFITIKSSLVPLIEGLCAQIYFRFEISVVCSHLLLFFFVKEKTC